MMKVEQLVKELELTQLTTEGTENEITGGYAGDLLSVVMNGCSEGCAWITLQTHPNILQVADLSGAACVIIAGGADVDESLAQKATDKGIALLSSNMEVFELAWKIHEVIK